MELSERQKLWLKGAAAAFVGGALVVLSEGVTDDAPFTSWRKMLVKALVGGGGGLYAYMKQSPLKSPLPTEAPKPEEKQS